MSFFIRILLIGFLGGLVACENQENNGQISNGPVDGHKLTAEEARQFQTAKANQVAIQHRSIEVLGATHNSVAFRSTILINDKVYALTMDQRLERGESKLLERTDLIHRDDPNLRLEVRTYRIPQLWNGQEHLGIEYRLGREGVGSSSQFLRITLGHLGTSSVVLKQKFEFPRGSDLIFWSNN